MWSVRSPPVKFRAMTVKERLQQVVSEMNEDEGADALALVADARAGATPADVYDTAWGEALSNVDPKVLAVRGEPTMRSRTESPTFREVRRGPDQGLDGCGSSGPRRVPVQWRRAIRRCCRATDPRLGSAPLPGLASALRRSDAEGRPRPAPAHLRCVSIAATVGALRSVIASACQRSIRINSRASSNGGESCRGANNDHAALAVAAGRRFISLSYFMVALQMRSVLSIWLCSGGL